MKQSDGSMYEGLWENDRRNGQGSNISPQVAPTGMHTLMSGVEESQNRKKTMQVQAATS